MNKKKRIKHLFFDKVFEQQILSGEKKSTLRLGKIKVERGSVLYIHCNGKLIGKVKIKKVKTKTLHEITDEDAKIDGFKTKKDLFTALKNYYGKIEPNQVFTQIFFELVENYTLTHSEKELQYCGYSEEQLAEEALKHLNLENKNKEILVNFLQERNIPKTLKGKKKIKVSAKKMKKLFLKIYKELLRRNVFKLENKGF